MVHDEFYNTDDTKLTTEAEARSESETNMGDIASFSRIYKGLN